MSRTDDNDHDSDRPRAESERRLVRGADPILVADADPEARHWLRTVVGGRFGLDEVEPGDAAIERIASGAARIVIVGHRLADTTSKALRDRATATVPPDGRKPVTFLLAGPDGGTPPIDDTEIPVFYRLVRGMDPARVSELMMQAAATLPPLPPRDADPAIAAIVGARVRAIGVELEPAAAAQAAIAAVIELVAADGARCLYCDDEHGRIWSGAGTERAGDRPPTSADAREFPVSAGLAGFAVRAGVGVLVPRAADDALYHAELDNPGGTGRERLAVQPVAGPDGHVHAVLIAVRDARRPAFTEAELDKLEALATGWAPYLLHMSMRIEADTILGDRLDRGPSGMFRQEALLHLVRRGQRGDVVRVHPGWVRTAYWLVLASLTAAVIFAAIAHVHQYAEGAGVVRFTGRSELVAHETGTIDALDAVPGQRVQRGQILARLHDAEQAGQLATLETEFERELVAYLQAPGDLQVKQTLGEIRSQRDRARLGVEERRIRAPQSGVVKEVLVRNGQRITPGAPVLSLVADTDAEGIEVLAFLPGSERPRLRVDQALRLTLPGYPGAHLTSQVRAISEVLGAAEARARFLGDRLGDSVPLRGTVVVVQARLTSAEFEADGEKLQLHDGMLGVAEVQMQSRSLLQALLPELR
jgi:multidrug efflux pump subunit AcrA (membrane-fusion protein)